MRRSPVQRVLSRGVYEEQYETSLRECMVGAEGYEDMLAAHRALVSALMSRWYFARGVEAWSRVDNFKREQGGVGTTGERHREDDEMSTSLPSGACTQSSTITFVHHNTLR